jgi:hypothetical protein
VGFEGESSLAGEGESCPPCPGFLTAQAPGRVPARQARVPALRCRIQPVVRDRGSDIPYAELATSAGLRLSPVNGIVGGPTALLPGIRAPQDSG